MRRAERKKRPLRSCGIAVIGEGPTEQYYLLSIQGLMEANIYPKIAKDGIDYLAAKVEECIAEGYDKIYCLIDMDNKSGKKEGEAYKAFLRKYSGKIIKNRFTGGNTEIVIVENHPCMEIWFYYYFKLTTGLYSSYDKINPLKSALHKHLPEYEKSIDFFRKCGGLHQYLTAKGGDIQCAIKNSELSMSYHASNPDGAFSEMSLLLQN